MAQQWENRDSSVKRTPLQIASFLTVSDSLRRNALVLQTDCFSSCPGGWSQTILEVKMLDVVVLGWCGYTWSWGRLDILPNSLKCLWRWLMVEMWTLNSRTTALVDIPSVSMPIARSLKTCDVCGIVLCDKTAHFRVAFYCGQPKAHLCNNHAVLSASWYATPGRWMDYLDKEVLTNTDLWTIFERNRPFVYIEKVFDLWVQLMKNGGKNTLLFSVYKIWVSLSKMSGKNVDLLHDILIFTCTRSHSLYRAQQSSAPVRTHSHTHTRPTLIRNAESLTIFKQHLKTHLFRRHLTSS